ncbi:unnamed protein product [Nippostrongylus brasiliensis]|uniref:Uncharacterized protein n=1 Tax=Nippostrongylus brasiliensis TaxID=27835 RepID=A0A0N4YGU8_NIPBR|nr:unnamed protein product [Nippostrongylus brasiliensis]
MAAATNRFSPPALTFALRRDGNHDLSNGVTPTTFERQILLANGLNPTMLLRDVPPPVPPPAQPTALILPLPFESRIPSTGIGVVETPLVVDQPLNELRQPPRPKLPSRHEDSDDDSFRMF